MEKETITVEITIDKDIKEKSRGSDGYARRGF